MQWIIKDSELLLVDDEGVAKSLPARTIWECYRAGGDESLPSLQGLDLRFSAKFLSLQVRLTTSPQSTFGVLRLEARSPFDEVASLSDDHVSSHVVADGVWSPLHEGAVSEIRGMLSTRGISIGVPLNPRQYLVCVRDFGDKTWFINDNAFTANKWALDAATFEYKEPTRFVATLAEYQARGSEWLTMMRRSGVGTILGDSMGLGKTVQAIRSICDLIEEDPDARTLVICPSALVENWSREIDRFTRNLTYKVHVGPDRSRNYRTFTASIMLTTYDIARMDIAILSLVKWDLVILDEAQFIKNPKSQRTKAIKRVPRKAAIAMTGTPFENHMTDIWSLFDFCLPDFLGSIYEFESQYADEEESAARLGSIIAPLLLRRTLDDVPNDLPPLITVPMPIALTRTEAEEYERRKDRYVREVSGLGAIGRLVSDLACPQRSTTGISSAKFEYLDLVMSEVIASGEKIIVFVERKTAIAEIERTYRRSIPVFVLNGTVPIFERQGIVDEYSQVRGSALLLCNPTVGGAGLNITAANHVFHFSMQWNPAKFDQADARAHRRGQVRTVVSHYPYYARTVEEHMWKKVAAKRDLAAEVVTGNKADSDADDIAMALSLSPIGNDMRVRN